MNRPPRGTRKGEGDRVSLARVLSKFGAASRSTGSAWITAGRVSVNGRVVRDPALRVDPGRDRITLDGTRLRPAGFVYFLMHKPAGVVTTRSDERGRRTVTTLLPAGLPPVFPVGRLDLDTSGMLIFTNDTRFGERLTSPHCGIRKTYCVSLGRPLQEMDRTVLEGGMTVRGVRYGPASLDPGKGPLEWYIGITEGKNRQIRNMFAALGYEVCALHRVSIGCVGLGTLRPGVVRPLSAAEVASLAQSPGRREARRSRHPRGEPRAR